MTTKHAETFHKLKIAFPEPRVGFDAYVAVWGHANGETLIGAPTLDGLVEAWRATTGGSLDVSRAQHVILIASSIPPELLERARQLAQAVADGDAAIRERFSTPTPLRDGAEDGT